MSIFSGIFNQLCMAQMETTERGTLVEFELPVIRFNVKPNCSLILNPCLGLHSNDFLFPKGSNHKIEISTGNAFL